MVAGGPALFGVKLGQLDRLGNVLVENNDRSRRQRLLGERARESKCERAKDQSGSPIHLQFDFQTVVGDADTARQTRFFSLGQFVTNMSKQRPARFDLPRDFQSLGYAQMGRMGLMPERIDDEDFYASNLMRNLLRHTGAVAQVSDELSFAARKQITVHGRAPVR